MKRINKKGFTLVELLAVIAILAILMLLVMPNILGMFTRGRKEAFITEAQSLWKSAEQKYVTGSIGSIAGNSVGPYCSDGIKLNSCEQIDGVSKSFKYYIEFDDTGKVTTFNLMDSNYNILGAKNIDFKADDKVKENGNNKKFSCSGGKGSVTCTVSAS